MTPEELVRDHTVYACVAGSRAFGLATEDSDTDRRGVFLAPTHLFWGFGGPPTHVPGPLPEQFSWELERFCSLALQADPNVLECLHSPLVEQADEVGRELLELRGAFLSRRAHGRYVRYATAQRRKLQAHAERHGEVRWKQAMHVVRLLIACAGLLATGELVVGAGEHRERLLAVRRGEVPWPTVQRWTAELLARADAAVTRSPLPEEPDVERVADFLYRMRRASALAHAGLPRPRQEASLRAQPDAHHEVVQGRAGGGLPGQA